MKFIKKCLGCVFYDNTCNEECIKCFKKNYKNFEPDLEPLVEEYEDVIIKVKISKNEMKLFAKHLKLIGEIKDEID